MPLLRRPVRKQPIGRKKRITDLRQAAKAMKEWKEALDSRETARRDARAEQKVPRKIIAGFNLKFRNEMERYRFFHDLREGILPEFIFRRISPNGIMELIRLGHGPKLVELLQKYFYGEANDNEAAELQRLFKMAKERGKHKDKILRGHKRGWRLMRIEIERVQEELQQMMQQQMRQAA